MDMCEFADFLTFREEAQQAFRQYHVDAAPLTIDSITADENRLIGRVVWKSPLTKVIFKEKSYDALHITLMDANGVEITGRAWAQSALKFNEVLKVNSIYKFFNVFPIRRTEQSYSSRLQALQNMELRFFEVVAPEEVTQDPYPNIDHNVFRVDYQNVSMDEYVHLVGMVNYARGRDVLLVNGEGFCIRLCLSEEKSVEFFGMKLGKFGRIVGFYGAKKIMDEKITNLGPVCPRIRFTTFDDTIIIPQPNCQAARNLTTWQNQYMITQEVEDIY